MRKWLFKKYWLWKNRGWRNCRHKQKALFKALRKAGF
jgi:hypothetical protein